jgi:hypothetical protein
MLCRKTNVKHNGAFLIYKALPVKVRTEIRLDTADTKKAESLSTLPSLTCLAANFESCLAAIKQL